MSSSNWTIDSAHSDVIFSIKHLGISTVRGKFNGVTGTASFDPTDLSSLTLSATIDATTIDTGNDQRDAHVKSADFLDVEKYPTLSFVTTGVATKDPGSHKIAGDLTLHGVTKPVTLDVEGPEGPVTDPYGNEKVAASATTTINRKDFDLSFHGVLDNGSLLLADDVKVTLEIQLIKSS